MAEAVLLEHATTIGTTPEIEEKVASLLARMSREEKIGQMQQVTGAGGHVPADLADAVRQGRVGSIINEVDPDTVNTLQWIATRESRLGIPLLIGRDVIHGFRTVQPIPLGQAATWNPALVEEGARAAALEASAAGVNWTFAPMVDIGRDPRWGRVAEGSGEDPWLTSCFARAAVRGFQSSDPSARGAIAACVKHFAGYGASEGGRDYNNTDLPERVLRDVHLPPFRAGVEAGALTLMTSFSSIDGIPATANDWLLQTVLRGEWGFDGLVVSDWDSVQQLAVHGLTDGDRSSAAEAFRAGVDMEMNSRCYAWHLAALLDDGVLDEDRLDVLVANILRVKCRLGLFEDPYATPDLLEGEAASRPADAALALARESLVLLRNEPRDDAPLLPLDPARLARVAVIGPLADDGYEQMGTWVFDGEESRSITVLAALRAALGDAVEVTHVRGVANTRTLATDGIDAAVTAARESDVVIAVLGEEAILSGEAHCRADVSLPGAQRALLEALAEAGTPVVLVVMAGRALALGDVVEHVDAMLYAWHPGSFAGPAITDVLLGRREPSGRLPVSLPRARGQTPVHYAHGNTGKPPVAAAWVPLEDIDARAPQVSVGNTSYHLDVYPTPLYPFGFGLTYGRVRYEHLALSAEEMRRGESLTVSVDVVNESDRVVHEVVQLYLRDPVASAVRPVRELRGFRKLPLAPGARERVEFTLTETDLAFHTRDYSFRAEAGRFDLWVGADATALLGASFTLVD